jgi:NADH dehydrogenase
MKNIVIAGAGFGGLRCALDLEKSLKSFPEYKVIVIDQNPYHLYTPSLYEIATAQLPRRCVCLPYSEVFSNKKITFIHQQIKHIKVSEKLLETESGDKISYEFLVLALGARTDYFGVPGLEKYSFGFKSLPEALKLRNYLEEVFKNTKEKLPTGLEEDLSVVVGGAGFSGVELAGELSGYLSRLCRKYSLRPEKITLSLVEARGEILSGLPKKISVLAKKRLEKLKVRLLIKTAIAQVKPSGLVSADGTAIPSTVVVWTGGVRANPLLEQSGLEVDKKGRLSVDENLRYLKEGSLFALGDNASFIASGANTAVLGQAEVAIDQGRVVAKNIIAEIFGRPLTKYQPKVSGFVIPIKGNYAIALAFNFIFSGYFAIVLKKFIELRYLFSVLPPFKALKFFRPEAKLLIE